MTTESQRQSIKDRFPVLRELILTRGPTESGWSLHVGRSEDGDVVLINDHASGGSSAAFVAIGDRYMTYLALRDSPATSPAPGMGIEAILDECDRLGWHEPDINEEENTNGK